MLFARLLSGYGRDASLNAKERKAPGSVAVVQLPGSPMAVHSRCGSEGGRPLGTSRGRTGAGRTAPAASRLCVL